LIASEKPVFRTLLEDMARPYRDDMSKPLLRVYWRALEDCPLEDVQRAVHQLERTSKWLPKPADIRDEITRHRMATRDTRGEDAVLLEPSPADIRAQRQQEQADPAVKLAQALKLAWAERDDAVAHGLSLDDAAEGFARVLRELMPPQTADPPCSCHHGLRGFRTVSFETPCGCSLGAKWRAMAQEMDDKRRWIVKAREKALTT